MRRQTIKFSISSALSTDMVENLELLIPIYCVIIDCKKISLLTFGLSTSSQVGPRYLFSPALGLV